MNGRPSRKPTAAERAQVQRMAADGWAQDRIAHCIGVSRGTLALRFGEDLETGADRRLAILLDGAFAAARKGNATAIRWLMKRLDAARQVEGDDHD